MLSDDKIKRIAAALAEVTDIVRESIAEENPEPHLGSIVAFVREWDGRSYHYAAVRSGSGWYLTGKAGKRPMTWLELQAFAGDSLIRAMAGSYTIRRKQGGNDIRQRLIDAMPADFRNWWESK